MGADGGAKMKGIRFVVDDKGRKVAVIIDLRRWGKHLEDFFDIVAAEERRDEPLVPLDEALGKQTESKKRLAS